MMMQVPPPPGFELDPVPPPLGFIPGTGPKPKEPPARTPAQAAKEGVEADIATATAPASIRTATAKATSAEIAPPQDLRKEFAALPEVKEFANVLPIYASALKAAPGGAGDLNVIYGLAKMLDPGSVVRESELTMAQGTGSLGQRLQGYYKSVAEGGNLPPEVRKQLIAEMNNRSSAMAQRYNQQRIFYKKLAEEAGIDPDLVVGPHPSEPFQQAEADYKGRPIINMDKGVGAVPKGWDSSRAADGGSAEGYRDGALRVDVSDDRVPWETEEQYKARSQRGDPPPPPDISDIRGRGGVGETVDAVVRGVADIPTFGFADEIAAGAGTLFGDKSYRENLARERATDDYDTEKHFPSRFAGQIGGGLLLPMGRMGSFGQVAGKSAGLGGAYGIGSGRGDVGDRLESGAVGAFAGGVLGPALYGVGRGVSVGARRLRNAYGPAERNIPPLVDLNSGRLNEPLQDATPAQRMAAAKEFGIDLPLDAAGDRGMAILGKGLDNLPASAGTMNDARRITEGQVGNALEDVASRYGQSRSLYAGGQEAQRANQSWIDRAQGVRGDPTDKGVVGKAYDAIPISDKASAILNNSKATLGELTGGFQSNEALAEVMKNPKLEAYSKALVNGELSWGDLKAFRTHIGNEISDRLITGDAPNKGQLRALYGALSEDMRATAASQGPAALKRFERANNLARDVQARIENDLTTILGPGAMKNPEAAAAAIQKIAQGGKGAGNIEQLRNIRASAVKGGHWNEVASSMISLMGQPAKSQGRAFDPAVFVRSYADMSEEARKLLFGDRGRAALRSSLDDFVRVNQRLAGTNALRNTSNTAPGIFGGGAVASAAALMTNPLLAPKLAGLWAGNYALGKLWTSPKFVNWATGYSKAAAKANSDVMNVQMGRLQRLAVENPQLRDQVSVLLRHLTNAANDNATRVLPAAASGANEK